MLADVGAQILEQRLLAHVLNNGLRRVIGAFVFVVFEQVLENMPEHFGIDADLVLLGIVFVDGEVVLGEELEQVAKEIFREIDRPRFGENFLEESAIEVRNACSGRLEYIARAVGIV